ncbi:MAG TPA: hypothetical protein VFT59_04995, partial [Candidatus Saccharimonadales bacterium]|nr:hypothetical protein [Candidatus Saccharimonadales bacterium]
MEWIIRYRIAIISIFVVVIVAVIGYNIYVSLSRAGKTKVDIVVVPKDAAIKVNGQSMRPPLYLTPGDYTFSASKEGFAVSEKTKTITSEGTTVVLRPTPES